MNTLIYIEKEDLWDENLLALPDPHVLQSWTWGELKASQGWDAERLLWKQDERVVAAAQVLLQQRGHVRLGYVPKGPILDWTDAARVEAILADLEQYAREHKLLLLKIDPDVRSDTEMGQAVQSMLAARSWQESFEQIQFRNTMMLDLKPDLDTLMAEMKSKWRYNIRLAVRRDVVVREAEASELPVLYEMYAETADRDNFIIRDEVYYLEAWQNFIEAQRAIPLVAEVEGEPVAMMVLFRLGKRTWYMYGASLSIHRNLMPNHLLQWEAIRRSKALGCSTYDLWGAPDELDESDPMWGVYRFKVGFGAEFVPFIGAYDYAPKMWLYRLYAFLRPRMVALAQWRYWMQKNS